MNISESQFLTLSQKLLLDLSIQIEDQDIEGEIDIELQDGILTLELEEKVFVINKQSALRQIWLSSPISGPYHFHYDNLDWTTKNGIKLLSLLEQELKMKFKYEGKNL